MLLISCIFFYIDDFTAHWWASSLETLTATSDLRARQESISFEEYVAVRNFDYFSKNLKSIFYYTYLTQVQRMALRSYVANTVIN